MWGKAMNETKDLREMEREILEAAERSGVQSNYFFRTTFERYQTQLSVLDKLKAVIDKDTVLVTKEYVKGRENIYTNPAVNEYNRTTDSANKTVSTLMKIIKSYGTADAENEPDPIVKALSGGEWFEQKQQSL